MHRESVFIKPLEALDIAVQLTGLRITDKYRFAVEYFKNPEIPPTSDFGDMPFLRAPYQKKNPTSSSFCLTFISSADNIKHRFIHLYVVGRPCCRVGHSFFYGIGWQCLKELLDEAPTIGASNRTKGVDCMCKSSQVGWHQSTDGVY